MKTRHAAIQAILDKLEQAVEQRRETA